VSVKTVLKNIGVELTVEASLHFVRRILLKKLEAVTPQTLYETIKRWDRGELKEEEVLGSVDEQTWSIAKRLSQRFSKYLKYLTPELVLRWLRRDRPDLASIILNHPKGIQFLAWLLNAVLRRLGAVVS